MLKVNRKDPRLVLPRLQDYEVESLLRPFRAGALHTSVVCLAFTESFQACRVPFLVSFFYAACHGLHLLHFLLYAVLDVPSNSDSCLFGCLVVLPGLLSRCVLFSCSFVSTVLKATL